eukprot:gene1562-946_t
MGLLRITDVCLKRAKGYNNRVMVYAHRRNKARYLAPKNPFVRSPLANKSPEEYGETWNPRSGIEWYNRLRQRGAYRHWPWAKWSDDPVRFHEDETSRRTISALHETSNECLPLWDYYAEVGMDYRTSSDAPLAEVGDFIQPYVGSIWGRPTITRFLETIKTQLGIHTVEEAAAKADVLLEWAEDQFLDGPPSASSGTAASPSPVVPKGFVQHVVLVCRNVVLCNQKKAFRATQHTEKSVLRTRDMERYYTLPYLNGPDMPRSRAQASGAYPWGKYTMMNDLKGISIHPLQLPDRWFKENMYPV